MDRQDILSYILIGFVIIICLKLIYESDTINLRCVISDVDGNKYCVREREQVNQAADRLARTVTKCKSLITHLHKNHPNNDITKRLLQNFNPKKVMETLPTSEHTAYSENKGEKLAFCLNSSKEGTELIDENTLMFVALHELAHIITISVGDNSIF